jgi:hypothetical protein
MTGKRWHAVAAVAAVLYLGAAAAAEAQQTVSSSGHGVFVPQASESYQLPSGETVQRDQSSSFIVADDPNSPFHLTSWNCTGTVVMSADGTSGSGGGYCDGVDSDGDVWWIWWNGAGGGEWGFLGGTGKFEGIEGVGIWKIEYEWPDGKFINSWEITYTMK